MSGSRVPDPTGRRLRAALREDAEAAAPDRVLEAVFARTQGVPQARRRPWDGLDAWPVGLRLAARRPLVVAIVAIALATLALLPLLAGGALTGPGPTPTRAPAAVPSPVAVACAGGRGLAGDSTRLWVACPSGIQPVVLAPGSAVAGAPVAGVGLPSVGRAGTYGLSPAGVVALGPLGVSRVIAPVAGARLLAVGDARVYATDAQGRLVAIDPASGAITATVRLEGGPLALLAVGRDVWVATDDGVVRRRDGATLAVTLQAAAGPRPSRLAATSTAVYALSLPDGRLTRVDLATGGTTQGDVGDPADPAGLDLLAADDNGVWVSRRTEIVAVDPVALAGLAALGLPDYPTGIVLDGRSAWVAGSTGRVDRVTLP